MKSSIRPMALLTIILLLLEFGIREGGAAQNEAARNLDAEEQVSRHNSANSDYNVALQKEPGDAMSQRRSTLKNQNLTDEQFEERRRWFAQRYAGTDVASKVADDRASELFEAGAWDRFPAAAAEAIDVHPLQSALRAKLLYMLVRVANNKEVPDADRRAAFDVLRTRVQNAPVMLAMTGNYLSGRTDLSAGEKYRLAAEAVAVAGPSAKTRDYLWRFLEPHAREAPDTGRKLVGEFVRENPQDCLATLGAREFLLESAEDDPEAPEKLRALREEKKTAQAEVKRLTAEATAAAEVRDLAGVERSLVALAALPDWATESNWYGNFVMANAEWLPLPVLEGLVERVPNGASASELAAGISRIDALYRDKEGVRFLWKVFDKYADDIQRDGAIMRSRLRRMREVLADPELHLAAHQKAAEIALRLGMKEVAAEFLFEVGKLQVWLDPALGRQLLAQAADLAPGTSGSVEAGWLLALLEGRMNVVAPLAARMTLPGEGSEPPEVSLPKNVPADEPAVVSKNDSYSLRPQNPDSNPARWADRFGSASRSEDRWEPASLPASVMVPLEGAATLQTVRVKFSAPSKFTVSLLAADGRILSRVARDWPLWDPMDLAVAWPGGDQQIVFPPVAGARFIRVDLYESMTDRPALEGLEARATPFVADGFLPLEPQTLPAGTHALTIRWKADRPVREVVYDMTSETVAPYPIARWFRPWDAKRMRDNLGIAFRGEKARLSIVGGPGRLLWSLNDGPVETYEQTNPVDRKAVTEKPLTTTAPSGGRQMLRLTTQWVNGRSATTFDKLIVEARGEAGVRVRFGDGKTWEDWLGPFLDGTEVTVAPGRPVKRYQVGVVLDSRALQAQETPVLSGLETVPASAEWDESPPARPLDATLLPEDIAKVVERLAGRGVAVVYSKTGTRAEYDVARRIAERAGVPLISDDVGLNLNGDYYGPVLAVGTPRDNRFARQLIAMCGVWDDSEFLNNPDGVVTSRDDIDGRTYDFVTGDTPAAVVKAGERLLEKIPQYSSGGDKFRLFPSNTLEVVYPWQARLERPEPTELSLRLGVNDRRNLQFGLTANTELAELDVSVSPLEGPDGSTLPAPEIRTVGGYEWIQFFGDLRLPNFLVAKPTLPVPAFTSLGYWITVRTPADAKPGEYRGTVTVASGGFTRSIPLRVEVLPVPLPDFARIDTFSYASVPWWYLPGTEAYDKAVRELAENEAEKRVNTVDPTLVFTWKVAENEEPVRYAIAERDAVPADLKWLAFTKEPKKVAAGEALFVEFLRTIKPSEIGGGFWMEGSELETSAVPGGAFAPQKPLVEKNWSAVRVPTPGAEARVFRFAANDGKPFQAGAVRAFLNTSGPIVAYDFSTTFRELDIFEEVYRKAGLAVPNFHMSMPNVLGPQVANQLFGVGHWHGGGGVLATEFVAQLKDQLKVKGRDARTILKIADEPRSLAEWAEIARPFKEGGLRVMTAHYSGRPDVKEAVGIMNPWCPNFEHNPFDPVIRAQQKAGDRVWWYQCGVPSTRLTGQPANNLPIYWLTAKWNLDGVANYAALGAKESGPEGSAIPFRYDHGLAFRMNYLPDGSLVDTPRRELEAEGIMDYTVIEWIRDRIAGLKASGKSAEAERLTGQLDAAIESVAPAIRGFPTAPEPWLAARDRLYDLALESLK